MSLIKSKFNSLAWLKSAIYVSVVGGVILFSKSVSAALISFSLVDINVSVPELVNPSGVLTPSASLLFLEEDNGRKVNIIITGGDFDSDSTRTFTIVRNFWAASFAISQDAGFINDVLSVSGSLTHTYNPDPGETLPDPFIFNFVLDADDSIGNTITDQKMASLAHLGGSHSDTFNAQLTATISRVLNFEDITTWTLSLSGTHPAAVPEPTTLFGSALALSLGGWLKRKKSNQRNKTTP